MNGNILPLSFQERLAYRLRLLYSQYGYCQYRMSKFEQYDLYARNKDFLLSDAVITFTDPDGKLMALKPDVTLSIVKNTADIPDSLQKLYYHENVYRVTKGSHSFRELMQVGLECLGAVDDLCICEVLDLACKSLDAISEDAVLTVSHLGLLLSVLDQIGLPENCRKRALKAIGQKNIHELTALCNGAGISRENTRLLAALAEMNGRPDAVIQKLNALLQDFGEFPELLQLQRIAPVLMRSGDRIRIDFSVVDDVRYYSGIVFKGFAAGMPTSVLTGGQYDRLMKRLGRCASAIGFAVYLDGLDRLECQKTETDGDILLIYGEKDPLQQVLALADTWRKEGSRVTVLQNRPEHLRFGRICYFDGEAGEHA